MKKDYIKYLGIDWGEARTGLALGDSAGKTATPFKTVSQINEIIAIIQDEEINEIVIGEPQSLNREGNIQAPYIEFLKKLTDNAGLPVHQIDERLTSKAADSLPGGRKDKAGRDSIAAMLILQSYLDRL